MQRLRQDVLRGVLVAIMMLPAFRARPFADAQILYDGILEAADVASLGGRIERPDLQDFRAAPCGLVLQHLEEGGPADIRDMLRELLVLQHVLDPQMLHGDDLVFVDEPCGELLKEVPAGVRDLLVDACCADALLPAVARAGHLPRQPALLPREFLMVFEEEAMVRDGIAGAVCTELFEPDIDAEASRPARREGDLLLYAEGDEVLLRCRTDDRCVQDAPLERAAEVDADVPNFRELEFPVHEADAVRLVARAVALLVLLPRFKLRVAGSAGEEVLVGFVEVAQGFLQRHGVNLPQPRRFLAALHVRQETARIFVRDALLV